MLNSFPSSRYKTLFDVVCFNMAPATFASVPLSPSAEIDVKKLLSYMSDPEKGLNLAAALGPLKAKPKNCNTVNMK